jgi:cell division protein FtsL
MEIITILILVIIVQFFFVLYYNYKVLGMGKEINDIKRNIRKNDTNLEKALELIKFLYHKLKNH